MLDRVVLRVRPRSERRGSSAHQESCEGYRCGYLFQHDVLLSESRGLASTRPLQERHSTIHFLAVGCRLSGPKVMDRYPPGDVLGEHRRTAVPPEACGGGEAFGRKQTAPPCYGKAVGHLTRIIGPRPWTRLRV